MKIMKNLENMKKLLLTIGLAGAALLLTACGSSSGTTMATTAAAATAAEEKTEAVADTEGTEKSTPDTEEKTHLVYAKGTGPYTILFEEHVMPILEEQGYTFEAVELTLQYADESMADGEVDFSVEQHTAYMEAFNKNYNASLTALSPIPTVPAAVFSATHESVDEIADGQVIAIPQDEGNQARAFVMLQDLGWIKLKADTDFATASAEDVEENPYNLQFYEIQSSLIPTSLDDYDYGVITGSIVYNAGMNPLDAVFTENLTDNFWLQVVVKEEDADTQWAKAIVDAYQSDEFVNWLKENNESEYHNLWSIPEYH